MIFVPSNVSHMLISDVVLGRVVVLMVRILISSLAILLFGSAYSPLFAQPNKITKKNIHFFSKTSSAKLLCYRKESRIEIVKMKGKRMLGSRLSVLDLNRMAQQIERLRGNSAGRGKKAKRALKKLRIVERQVEQYERARKECELLEEGFVGESTSLEKYRETLTSAEIDHLLNKVAFGGNDELRRIGASQGLTALVNALVDGVYTQQERRDFEARAEEWEATGRHKPEDPSAPPEVWTTESIQGGEIYRMIHSREPLREWMTLQLSAHLATNMNVIGFSYDWFRSYGLKLHIDLLRRHALGNFEELLVGLLTDPAMNYWLGNKDNSVVSPNQNFARELLELFALGAIHPYTKMPSYDEETVVAATSFVSGYQEDTQIEPYFGEDSIAVSFFPAAKDNAARSAFSGIESAATSGSWNAEGFIHHVLFQHPHSALYLAERFAGNMLYPGLPEPLAEELAALLLDHHYNLKPMLRRILGSNAMFSTQARNVCFQSPVEYFVSLARRIFPNNLLPGGSPWEGTLGLYMSVVEAASLGGQALFMPPSVFGWKKSCNINRNGSLAFGEEWIPAQLLLQRTQGCATIFNALSALDIDLKELFSLRSSTLPGDAARAIADRAYGIALSPSEEALVSSYFVQYTDDARGGTVVSLDPQFGEEWYVRQKVAGAVCAIGTLLRVQLR